MRLSASYSFNVNKISIEFTELPVVGQPGSLMGKKRLEAACFDLAIYSSSSPSPSSSDLLMNTAETQ
jgi:hypothetical protein